MISIRLVESKGRFFVSVKLDGRKLERRGPYRNSDKAEAAARQIAGVCQVLLHRPVHVVPVPGDWLEEIRHG